MTAIRQELGPAVIRFPVRQIQFRYRRDLPSHRWNTVNGVVAVAVTEEEGPLGSPCDAKVGSVTDAFDYHLHGPADSRDLFHLSFGDKAHLPAVGRPKRTSAVLGSCQRAGGDVIDRPKPEHVLATRGTCGENEIAAILRQRKLG